MMGNRITLSVDTSVGAAYINLSGEPVVETIELNPDVQVDLDASGAVVGVELLNLAADIPVEDLVAKFHFRSPDDALILSQIRPSIGAYVSSAGSGRAYVPDLQAV